MMNYFFAVKVHDFTHHVLSMFAKQWQQALPPAASMSWYAPEDYHITLRFLGNVEPNRVKDLIAAVVPITLGLKPFWLDVADYGAFPSLFSPKVLWIGIDTYNELELLSSAINSALTPVGYETDSRPYKPHITLGRCRNLTDATIPYQPPSPELMFGSFVVDRFVLMQTLPPKQCPNETKSRYNTVHLFPFGTTPSSAE